MNGYWKPSFIKGGAVTDLKTLQNTALAKVEKAAKGRLCYNRILDDEARGLYAPMITVLSALAPDMMTRKIAEANVQQGFVLDTVLRFAQRVPSPRILCVGSHEDTACVSLKALGYPLTEIDPVANYDLDAFCKLPSTKMAAYDLVFSTSVIEHVQDDEGFVREIGQLLAPGGVAVLTCDYNDAYAPGTPIPREDFRFYTQRDFRQRLLPQVPDCALVDTPQWECPEPDFVYHGCRYTFATLVFQKNA